MMSRLFVTDCNIPTYPSSGSLDLDGGADVEHDSMKALQFQETQWEDSGGSVQILSPLRHREVV